MDITQIMYRPGLMQGERILVTGGGTGLGKVMAEAFLYLGAEVHICGRRGAVLEATADELMTKHGGTVAAHVCDIRDAASIDAMVSAIWSQHGPLTGLVNNAAGNFISRTEDLSVNGFNAISDIVFRGTFYITHNVGKRMIAEGIRGNFLAILTTWVWNGGPFTVPSAMSKAGINVMTQSLATEWGRYGLRFNAIAPGTFPTKGMTERLSPGNSQGLQGQNADRGNPMGRVGEMHELANLAVLLMGRGADYINGQTIAIDGAGYQANSGNFYQSLSRMDDQQWADMAAMIRGANAKDKAARTTG
ncbi:MULTISPECIES: SDR family oxidoreductase [Pseudomonadota]|jgi:NAD(P)-dependent dehydrogenase (short-subunit alcohol dehydrogenase family)|uniref:SDR family oxidoreductase n=1 Tax=Pseudomonadota TaxID=1224 RepID=UPI00076A24CC|nr:MULTISPECIES: SDR family oxidoreductase [Pseudomonadota]MAF62382.1 short-chain dehydrogenase [Blastomonas sp.]MBA4779687.1 SDR family oxidoreductase [Blastomonas sp.]|tara:strand:+ start:73948 stop:74859 length:912 start_codon:yes stop_codon:yes gene_type:complete